MRKAHHSYKNNSNYVSYIPKENYPQKKSCIKCSVITALIITTKLIF